jgi:hypothetical protein
MSAQTRVMIDPTVRQAIRISCVIAVFEHRVASHATCSSNSRVCPAPCLAHGTAATTIPCWRQRTGGAWACRNTIVVPTSNERQRRTP